MVPRKGSEGGIDKLGEAVESEYDAEDWKTVPRPTWNQYTAVKKAIVCTPISVISIRPGQLAAQASDVTRG